MSICVRPVRSIAVVANSTESLINFRGEYLRALANKGLKVWALAPDFGPATRQIVSDLGAIPVDISLDRTGLKPLRDIADMLRLSMHLRRLRLDMVVGYFVKPVIYGMIAAFLAGVPRRVAEVHGLGFVFTPSGRLTAKRRLLRMAVAQMYRVAFGLSQRIFLFNEDDLRDFEALGVIDRAKVTVLPGVGVNLDHFEASPAPVEPFTFLMIARLLREKGVTEFLEAAEAVKRLHPKARFVLLGAIDSNPGAVSLDRVQDAVRSGAVEWPGQVADVRPFLRTCSVFVLPSYREGKPRSTQEAMAIGRAVITTDVPGCRDTIEHGRNGLSIPARDAEALRDAMVELIRSPEQVVAMGAESRRMAEQLFDVDRINDTTIASLNLRAQDNGS